MPVIFTAYRPMMVEFRPHDTVFVELSDTLIDEAGQFTVKPVIGLDVIVTEPTKSKVLFNETVTTAPEAPLLKFVRGRTTKSNPPTWMMEDIR